MKNVRSILFECSCYSGDMSHDRCKVIEEYVMGHVEDACRLETVTMREMDKGGNVIQPTIELVYSEGSYRKLVHMVDEVLREAGIVAIKALVSRVVSHAVEGVIAGAGAGWLAGSAATRGSRGNGKTVAVLVSTMIGAAAGSIGGKLATERALDYVAIKYADGWTFKKLSAGKK